MSSRNLLKFLALVVGFGLVSLTGCRMEEETTVSAVASESPAPRTSEDDEEWEIGEVSDIREDPDFDGDVEEDPFSEEAEPTPPDFDPIPYLNDQTFCPDDENTFNAGTDDCLVFGSGIDVVPFVWNETYTNCFATREGSSLKLQCDYLGTLIVSLMRDGSDLRLYEDYIRIMNDGTTQVISYLRQRSHEEGDDEDEDIDPPPPPPPPSVDYPPMNPNIWYDPVAGEVCLRDSETGSVNCGPATMTCRLEEGHGHRFYTCVMDATIGNCQCETVFHEDPESGKFLLMDSMMPPCDDSEDEDNV